MQALGAIVVKKRTWVVQLSSEQDSHVLQKRDGKWYAAPTGLYLRPVRGDGARCDEIEDVTKVEPPGTVASREAAAKLQMCLEQMFDEGMLSSSVDAPSFSASSTGEQS